MRNFTIWFVLTFFLLQASTKPADEPKTVKADADFAQTYIEVMQLQVTITQIERDTGIDKLRDRSNQKIAALRKWMQQHNVEGWQYDDKTQTFTEKKPATPAGEKKP